MKVRDLIGPKPPQHLNPDTNRICISPEIPLQAGDPTGTRRQEGKASSKKNSEVVLTQFHSLPPPSSGQIVRKSKVLGRTRFDGRAGIWHRKLEGRRKNWDFGGEGFGIYRRLVVVCWEERACCMLVGWTVDR